MELSQEVLDEIYQDQAEAQQNMERIKCNEQQNFFVLSQNSYLHPTVISNVLPNDDPRGEFEYYRTICDTLEQLLLGNEVKFTYHFNGAPDCIKNLLVKKGSA